MPETGTPGREPPPRSALAAVAATDAEEALDGAWREHWSRLLALLVARYRRLDLAEDGLGDAFAAAAQHWPADGVPGNPAAWLLTAARRRVTDRLRAEAVAARKEPLLVVDADLSQRARQPRAGTGEEVPDERLRLVLLCAHPALSPESSSMLTLRLVIGLAVPDIARLFLAQDTAVAARITRAKRRIVATGMPFALPARQDLAARVDRVADVAYLSFTAGYVPGPGTDLFRAELAGEALRLLRVVRELTDPTPTVDLVVALMLLHHSRRDARVDPLTGDLVRLPDQDRSRWHRGEIAEALDLLEPHVRTPPGPRGGAPRLLEALIAAEHALAPTAEATRWDRIANYYDQLERLTGSPVVRLNRAVAVAESEGPVAGLTLLDGLEPGGDPHRLPAVRAELLARCGRPKEATTAYREAIALCRNEAERTHLDRRLRELNPADDR